MCVYACVCVCARVCVCACVCVCALHSGPKNHRHVIEYHIRGFNFVFNVLSSDFL